MTDLDSGLLAYQNKEYDKAIALFDKYLLVFSENERAHRMLGLSLLQIKRYREAKRSLDIAFKIEPNMSLVRPWLPTNLLQNFLQYEPCFIWTKYHLAYSLFEVRSLEQSLALCRDIAEEDSHLVPLKTGAFELECEILRRRIPNLAIKEISNVLARKKTTIFQGSHAFFQGLVDYGLGHMTKSLEMFEIAAQDSKGLHNRLPVSVGSMTYKLACDTKEVEYYPEEEIVDYGTQHIPCCNDVFVLSCACDGRYFKLFFETYFASALYNCGNILMHVHIVDPLDDFGETIEFLRHAVPWARVNFTTSKAQFRLSRPFYATARYLIGSKLLSRYNLPLFITDVDSAIVKKLPLMVPQMKHGIGIKYNTSGHLEYPWTAILATYTFVPPNREGRWFFESIRKYFWSAFDRNGAQNAWFVDQNALMYVASITQRERGTIFDLTGTPLDRPLSTYSVAESKEAFVARMRVEYPLNALNAGPLHISIE